MPENNGVKILETYNTLESDLVKSNFLEKSNELLEHITDEIYVAKKGKKTLIAEKMIDKNINLSNWHIIKDIENEFKSH